MESQNTSPTDELQEAIRSGDLSLAQKAVSRGADVVSVFNGVGCTPLGWATFWGLADIVELLINAGAPVPVDALKPLGEMDITDWIIDPIELEPVFARVAEILVIHGASPDVMAFDGRPLIQSFPVEYYPNIYRVLSDAIARLSNKS